MFLLCENVKKVKSRNLKQILLKRENYNFVAQIHKEI